MFDGKQVIGVTPAGRQRYLEVLIPHLLAQRPVLDKHVFWINTDDLNDIDYILETCAKYPDFFEAEPLPEGIVYDRNCGSNSIHSFFPGYCSPNTLYVRFDDDICWVGPDVVSKMAEAISRSDCFIAYANIINNAVITYYHQRNKRFLFDDLQVEKDCLCPIGWGCGKFATKMHYQFLEAVRENSTDYYTLPDIILNPPLRVSINCIMWKGECFAEFGGKVALAEEQFLSDVYPKSKGLSTMIVGNAIVAHYAFYTQRPYMESTSDILKQYKALSPIPISE